MKSTQSPLNSNDLLDGGVVFQHKGEIYSRPIGRGIEFVQENGEFGIFWKGEVRDISLEDVIPEGYFEIEITVRKKKAV